MNQNQIIPAILELQKRVSALEGGSKLVVATHTGDSQTVKLPDPPRK